MKYKFDYLVTKKHLVIALLLCNFNTKAQNISITSKYKPTTYDEYVKPLEGYWEDYKAFEQEIDAVCNWIIKLLGHNIDNQMRDFLNSKYQQTLNVSSKLEKQGLVLSLKRELKEIVQSIQTEIANYNNRIAQHNTVTKSTTEKQGEPGNNLGKSLDEMNNSFPKLRYIGIDEKGQKYQDGEEENGISVFFYIKNDIVIEECLLIKSNDGFAFDLYNTMYNKYNEYSKKFIIENQNSRHFLFSRFSIHLIFTSQDGINTFELTWKENGFNTGLSIDMFYDMYKQHK